MCDLGPKYGYYPNNRKTRLLVTPDLYTQAVEVFVNTGLEIVSDGVSYLGGVIGSEAFISEKLSQKVQSWVSEVTTLSNIAESEPHAAFAGFTNGVSDSWNYFARVTNISSLNSSSDPLLPLETVIYRNLIPQLTGLYDLSDTIHKLLSLPYRFGGLNITNPCIHLPSQYQFSFETCSPLIDYYFSNSTGSDITECLGRQQEIKSTVASRYHDRLLLTLRTTSIHPHNIIVSTYALRKEHQTGFLLSP